MKMERFVKRLQYSAACALLLIGGLSTRAMAQDHSHNGAPAAQNSQASALIQIVRDATARFQNPSDAVAAGYQLQFGCVSGPDSGAMGMHFVNGTLVNSGVIDARSWAM